MNGFFAHNYLKITIFGKLWGKLLTGSDVNLLLFKNYNPLLVQLFLSENFPIFRHANVRIFWGGSSFDIRAIPKLVIFLFHIGM